MKEFSKAADGHVHLYECVPFSVVLMATEENVVQTACEGCAASLTSFRFTVERCKQPGHHIVCSDCLAEIRGLHGEKDFKRGGYIRNNKLERIQ